MNQKLKWLNFTFRYIFPYLCWNSVILRIALFPQIALYNVLSCENSAICKNSAFCENSAICENSTIHRNSIIIFLRKIQNWSCVSYMYAFKNNNTVPYYYLYCNINYANFLGESFVANHVAFQVDRTVIPSSSESK